MIYCVEDDSAIRDLMLYTLQGAGFEAKGFADSKEFFTALESEIPELVLLDVMLPGDEDGIAILKRLRSSAPTAEIAVIMASAKGTEYDKVIGLDLGADDYLAKPFGMMEMVSRVKAVLRRSHGKEEARVLRTGNLELNLVEHTFWVQGERISLTLKEYELMELFLKQPGRVFTRDQLLEQVWGMDYVGETRTVDVHIGTLRAKLGSFAHYIETVRGVGYRMEAKI